MSNPLMNHAVLKPLAPRQIGEFVETAATLSFGGQSHTLWWRTPAAWDHARTLWADPFVVGFLFLMMEAGLPVRVEGRVSPSLLENLENFMAIWSCWVPGRYRPVAITAELEQESPPPSTDAVICPFSGGTDSAFSILRHIRGDAGRRNRRLGAAAVMNGFDVWHSQRSANHIFEGILREAHAQLAPLGIPVIPMDSNFHDLPVHWEHAFGTHLASGLMLMGREFHGALIPNNQRFHAPPQVYGSTPLTDRYLGSVQFPFLDDGGEVTRFEKIRYLTQQPKILDHLRVCFPTDGRHENCCACEKCIRTMLSFHIAGVPIPEKSFPHALTPGRIAGMKFHTHMSWHLWNDVLLRARQEGMAAAPWALALARAVRRGKRRRQWQELKRPFIPLRNQLRRIFRGSSTSRVKQAGNGDHPATNLS